jgi:hypothetical protein
MEKRQFVEISNLKSWVCITSKLLFMIIRVISGQLFASKLSKLALTESSATESNVMCAANASKGRTPVPAPAVIQELVTTDMETALTW